jgi:hypothetical protein
MPLTVRSARWHRTHRDKTHYQIRGVVFCGGIAIGLCARGK